MLTVRDMVSILRRLEKHDRWFFSAENAAFFTGRKVDKSLLADLHLYVEDGLLEYYGENLFGFDIAAMKPWNCQEILAQQLRPMEFNYLSFEYQLNQYGIISQIPTVMTVASTGKSGFCRTGTMNIEFVHVEHGFDAILGNCCFNKARGILEASPNFALGDLQSIGRNLHLVDEDAIEDAQDDYAIYIKKQ